MMNAVRFRPMSSLSAETDNVPRVGLTARETTEGLIMEEREKMEET